MIHFFSCTFTGNLRTDIVILPISQQRACTAHSKRTPAEPLRAGGDGRGARKNINYTRFQGLSGLHVQQTHYWAFSCRNSISVPRAGINRKSSHSRSKQTQHNCIGASIRVGSRQAAHPQGSGSVLHPTAGHSLHIPLQPCTCAWSLSLRQIRANLIHTARMLHHMPPAKEFGFSWPTHAGLLLSQPLVLAWERGRTEQNQPPELGRGLHSSYLKRRVVISEIPSPHG